MLTVTQGRLKDKVAISFLIIHFLRSFKADTYVVIINGNGCICVVVVFVMFVYSHYIYKKAAKTSDKG